MLMVNTATSVELKMMKMDQGFVVTVETILRKHKFYLLDQKIKRTISVQTELIVKKRSVSFRTL